MVVLEGKFYLSELGVNCWNICGIWKRLNSFRYNKLNDPYILKTLTKHQIFGLVETHHLSTEDALLHIDGYKCFNVCGQRERKHQVDWQYMLQTASGGVLLKCPFQGLKVLF